MLPFGPFVLALTAAALALDDLITFARGGQSVFGEFLQTVDGGRESLDEVVFAFDRLKAAVADFKMALEGNGNPFAEWKIDDAFLTILDQVESSLTSIAGLVSAITELLNGNFSEGFDKLADTAKRMLITENPAAKVVGWQVDRAKELAGYGLDQLNGFRKPESMPQAPAGQKTPTQETQVSAPINLQITVPAGSDGAALKGEDFQKKIQTAAKEAIKEAFAQVRANQAER
ncbi:hypothetical protein D3C80_844410 [compost metagenome]